MLDWENHNHIKSLFVSVRTMTCRQRLLFSLSCVHHIRHLVPGETLPPLDSFMGMGRRLYARNAHVGRTQDKIDSSLISLVHDPAFEATHLPEWHDIRDPVRAVLALASKWQVYGTSRSRLRWMHHNIDTGQEAFLFARTMSICLHCRDAVGTNAVDMLLPLASASDAKTLKGRIFIETSKEELKWQLQEVDRILLEQGDPYFMMKKEQGDEVE